MAKHATDNLGRPRDPRLRKLEDELQILAGVYRGASGDNKAQAEIVKEYQEVFNRLYELGWDGDLDIMSELPPKYMPERYLATYPPRNIYREDLDQRIARAKKQFESPEQLMEKETQQPKEHSWLRRIFKRL